MGSINQKGSSTGPLSRLLSPSAAVRALPFPRKRRRVVDELGAPGGFVIPPVMGFAVLNPQIR